MVGTIIVAAAVIIFLPDILDGEKESYQAEFEAIPKAPAFEGAKEHKAFPKEKLDSIPQEQISDEEAADDILAQANEPNVVADAEQQESKVVVQPAKQETKIELIKPQTETEQANTSTSPIEKDKLAWVIHLGSFKHEKNVDELMRKLKANKYTAFTQPIKTKKGMLTKVIVGPNLNKADLEKKLPDLKKLTKVQGRLARFKVTNAN